MALTQRSGAARKRRAYRVAFAAAIVLAAIGAPLFMQGAVAFVNDLGRPSSSGGGMVQGLLMLGLSASPMVLAWFAWRLTQVFQQTLDDDL